MSSSTYGLDSALRGYLANLCARGEPPGFAELRAVTATHEYAQMQISIEQGRFLSFLVQAIGARRCIEVGVFTGYSALCVAVALPADGQIVACDVSAEWTAIARPYWQAAGVAERIDLRIAPASETLRRLLAEGRAGHFDFAFIDADKIGYPDYYELCLALLRPGGIMAFDNAFMGGGVAAPAGQNQSSDTMRELNLTAHDDPRVATSLIPIGDGLLLCRKL